MRRILRVWIGLGWALVALSSYAPAAAQTAATIEERLIESRDYILNIKIQRGSDTRAPTIILEAGGGADSSQWAALQPRLSIETGATVVSYDRPGYGKSPLPNRPYDIVDEVEAFHNAVVELMLAERVILVGHSYGGLLIQLYANRWASTVHGLLFLDPNTPSAMLAFGSDTGQTPITNPVTQRDRANVRVDAAGRAPVAAVYDALLPLNVPLIVVSAETPPFRKPRQMAVFKLSHELLAASVEDGKHLIAGNSNHMIPAQRPDIVVDCVKQLMAKRGS
jgi:pimeloyl-ACP methyl ester carboxylesterase